jgi:hypothetical protein
MNKAKAKDKIYMGCRCYERLQPNTKEFTRLAYALDAFFSEKKRKKALDKPSSNDCEQSQGFWEHVTGER